MTSKPLPPIFRLAPSQGLRLVPIRGISPPTLHTPLRVQLSRTLQRAWSRPLRTDTNQMTS